MLLSKEFAEIDFFAIRYLRAYRIGGKWHADLGLRVDTLSKDFFRTMKGCCDGLVKSPLAHFGAHTVYQFRCRIIIWHQIKPRGLIKVVGAEMRQTMAHIND